MFARILSTTLLLSIGTIASAAEPAGYRLENYEYPFPVTMMKLESQRQKLEMAYMDLQPATPDGETVVLLHGKNFCGAYWGRTAGDLADKGYRVVIPDQIGFGKSSKPEHYQFSIHALADNTRALLDELHIKKAHILGHSMGGMVATRFVLMFPERSESLVLENPIGLEDWKRLVPYPGIEQWYANELKADAESIKAYQVKSYYHGTWKPDYEKWVEPLARMAASENYERVAWDQALTYDMIYTQPVVYEFPLVKVPALLIIGQLDRTALGKNSVPEEIAKTMGNYPELGRRTAAAIPACKLVELEGVGHLPHVEAYDRFLPPLLEFLDAK